MNSATNSRRIEALTDLGEYLDAKLGNALLGTKVAHGIGSMAFATKDAAFVNFVAFFYTQVVGLSGTLYGVAAFVGQLSDAISDPIVGTLADNVRSRWGRWHPFMVASIVPLALCFLLLFNPPMHWSGPALCFWLAAVAVALRHLAGLAVHDVGNDGLDDLHDLLAAHHADVALALGLELVECLALGVGLDGVAEVPQVFALHAPCVGAAPGGVEPGFGRNGRFLTHCRFEVNSRRFD